MKTETAAYATERRQLATAPVYVARFSHVKTYGDATAYPFSAQFSTGAVVSPSRTTRTWLQRPQGNSQTIQLQQGRSSIGGFTLSMVDRDGEFFRYLAAPPLTLASNITDVSPGIGDWLDLAETPTGLPAIGTVEIGSERIRYDLRDSANLRVRVSGRGVDDTTAAAHTAGDAVENGEQIRPGTRVQILAGYAPLDEADYMSLGVQEVTERQAVTDQGGRGGLYQIRTQDIQRTTRQTLFVLATRDAPVLLSGHPVTIALKVLTSTGGGTNGTYDVLDVENGLAVPEGLVDVAGLEALRDDEFPGDTYSFSITEPMDGKAFLETEIWKSLNCYPYVTQNGQYSARRYKTPGLLADAAMLGHRLIAVA